MKNGQSKSHRESLLKRLKNVELATAYLNVARKEGDTGDFLTALKNVADAQGGLKKLSAKTHLNLTSLYRMLSSSGNPNLANLESLLGALGINIVFAPRKKIPAKR